jgi:hypothetical protein
VLLCRLWYRNQLFFPGLALISGIILVLMVGPMFALLSAWLVVAAMVITSARHAVQSKTVMEGKSDQAPAVPGSFPS